MNDSNSFGLTEVPSRHFPSDLDIEQQKYQTLPEMLRTIKQKAKMAKKMYELQYINHHRAQLSLDKKCHESIIKRVQFVKLYTNKKAKFNHKQLLEKRKFQCQKLARKSVDVVKRRKLQDELQHILLQNEEQQHIIQLQNKNRKTKQMWRKQLEQARKRQQSLSRHDEIRKGNTQFLIRKKNIQTSISMRGRANYYSKVNQQLQIIKNYESIVNQMNQYFDPEQLFKAKSSLSRTVDSHNRTFLTHSIS